MGISISKRGGLVNAAEPFGRLDRAHEYYDLALEAARAGGDRRLETMALTNVAILCVERGRHDVAGDLGDARRFGREISELERAHRTASDSDRADGER